MAHFRRHWKKYTFGSLALIALGRWGWKKNEENNIIREYCEEAKKYGAEVMDVATRPRKVYVLLNPEANNRNARKRFEKCSVPLFHLSGMDVIVIEVTTSGNDLYPVAINKLTENVWMMCCIHGSDTGEYGSNYEGQIQTLLGYLESSTKALVVAGGGGTLMEVVNGLLRRTDKENLNIPIGIVPLGKDNTFFRKLYNIESTKISTRTICEATMDIIRGGTTTASVMKLTPDKGKVVYAMSSIEWGALHSAEKNKDSFKLLGRLRTVCSYINTAVRRWPEDFTLNLWQHPSEKLKFSTPQNSNMKLSSVNALGFKLLLDQPTLSLALTVWPISATKTNFIKQGWMRTLNKAAPITGLPQQLFIGDELSLSPSSTLQHWYSLDGEPFEAVSLHCCVLREKLCLIKPDGKNLNLS